MGESNRRTETWREGEEIEREVTGRVAHGRRGGGRHEREPGQRRATDSERRPACGADPKWKAEEDVPNKARGVLPMGSEQRKEPQADGWGTGDAQAQISSARNRVNPFKIFFKIE